MSDGALIVFLKHPEPGTVKTRLMPALGPEVAADLYRALSETVLETTVPGPGEYERLVFFAPPEAAEEVRAWLPGVRLLPQVGGDLGARMSGAFDRAFARGAERVAIIGTDSPAVSRATILEALDALGSADVVLGPAEDGGYYLLGLRRPQPALFERMVWSTSSVLAETVARAEKEGLRVRLLSPLRDIDTPEDLRAEWPRVRLLLETRPDLMRCIEALLGG